MSNSLLTLLQYLYVSAMGSSHNRLFLVDQAHSIPLSWQGSCTPPADLEDMFYLRCQNLVTRGLLLPFNTFVHFYSYCYSCAASCQSQAVEHVGCSCCCGSLNMWSLASGLSTSVQGALCHHKIQQCPMLSNDMEWGLAPTACHCHCGLGLVSLQLYTKARWVLCSYQAADEPNNLAVTFLALASKMQRLVEDLDDAQAELMLADDDEPARLLVGDSFWTTPKEEADDKLEALTEAAKEKQSRVEEQIAEIKEQMGQLKVVLYAKFGKSINLEE